MVAVCFLHEIDRSLRKKIEPDVKSPVTRSSVMSCPRSPRSTITWRKVFDVLCDSGFGSARCELIQIDLDDYRDFVDLCILSKLEANVFHRAHFDAPDLYRRADTEAVDGTIEVEHEFSSLAKKLSEPKAITAITNKTTAPTTKAPISVGLIF